MLKYFFRLLLLVGAVLGLIALVGSLLPRDYQVVAAMDFNVPLEKVYEKFHRLPQWKSWSTWNPDVVEGLEVEYTGESGVGSVMTWKDSRGEGKLWITGAKPMEWIDYKMTFANFPEATGRFEFVTQTDGLAFVEWKSNGKLPSGPFYGFWARDFSSHLQHEYQQSLEKLKAELERENANPTANPAADASSSPAPETDPKSAPVPGEDAAAADENSQN